MQIQISSNAADTAAELKTSLEIYQKEMEYTVFRAVSFLETQITVWLRDKSGLQMRSNALMNSIYKDVKRDQSGNVYGEVGSAGIPYAKIHEFGGTTKPHDIVPRNAKALKFSLGGGADAFAKIVHHPGSKISARPYFRPALAASKDQILKDFGLFLHAAFVEKKPG